MHAVAIGHDASASADHYLFWTGTTVVDATFAHPSADDKSALAALAAAIRRLAVPPVSAKPAALCPAQLDASTVKYAIGPVAYARNGGQLPAAAIDFAEDTEVVTAQYGSQGTLTLLLIPTPQIAGAHLKTLDALAKSSGFFTRRSGPLVAIVSGSASSRAKRRASGRGALQRLRHHQSSRGVRARRSEALPPADGDHDARCCALQRCVALEIFLAADAHCIARRAANPSPTVSEEEFISLHLN